MATTPPDDSIPEPPEPLLRPLPWPVRWLLQAFAVLCLVMGAIGVVVPGLPTTVFILMAAWAAARSSRAMCRCWPCSTCHTLGWPPVDLR